MNEKMEKALLECCERHTDVLSDEVVEFAYDLANTAIKVSDTKIDDAFLTVINATKPIVNGVVDKLVDKIDKVEGNLA